MSYAAIGARAINSRRLSFDHLVGAGEQSSRIIIQRAQTIHPLRHPPPHEVNARPRGHCWSALVRARPRATTVVRPPRYPGIQRIIIRIRAPDDNSALLYELTGLPRELLLGRVRWGASRLLSFATCSTSHEQTGE
jgi:hypothetical protein